MGHCNLNHDIDDDKPNKRNLINPVTEVTVSPSSRAEMMDL